MHVIEMILHRISALNSGTVADLPTRTFLLLPPRGLRCISRQYARLDPEALPVERADEVHHPSPVGHPVTRT